MQEKWLRVPTSEMEFKLLASDKMWRLHNLYYITNEQGTKTLFRPRDAQLTFLLERHGFDIILKARQLGFSTVVQIDMLDDCLFGLNENAAIIAQSMSDAEEIFATKLKFPYNNLPGFIKKLVHPIRDSLTAMEFNNGSKIRVGVSMRSSTLTNLHISEHGKICAKDPQRAREIRTGSLNAVHSGQKITIESTAEGREGDFFEFTKKARALVGKPLTPVDFKFHFYPWYENASYTMTQAVVISKEMTEYFDKLEGELKITLTEGQRKWYVKKQEVQQDDMKREFPSSPDEAFEQAIEGAFFAQQMALARKQNRISNVPFDPSVPVNTFWDLGKRDSTAIWFHQRVGLENRFIHYYENSGEHFPHYAKYLREFDCIYGGHYLPHDATKGEMRAPGNVFEDAHELLKGEIYLVPRVKEKKHGVAAVRRILSSCWIDQGQCDQGIKHLDNYKKEWNEKLGCWREKPVHDAASDGTDAFMQFAQHYDVGDAESSHAEDDFHDEWADDDISQAGE
jgi:hypothetical protein